MARGDVVVVAVTTGSMSPTLKPGESIPVRRKLPSLGDVVLLATPGEPTLHRLVAQLGPWWVHAGDMPEAGAGFCRLRDVLAVAALPRRTPSRLTQARSVLAALRRTISSTMSR